MLKFVTVAGLTALLTASAFAQSQPQTRSNARVSPQPQSTAATVQEDDESYEAFAAAPGFGDVIEGGVLLGRDPDPNVRLQLRRDRPEDWND